MALPANNDQILTALRTVLDLPEGITRLVVVLAIDEVPRIEVEALAIGREHAITSEATAVVVFQRGQQDQ